jgi:hypothetical protein
MPNMVLYSQEVCSLSGDTIFIWRFVIRFGPKTNPGIPWNNDGVLTDPAASVPKPNGLQRE